MHKFILVALFLLAIPSASKAAESEITTPMEQTSCNTDSDCVVVQTSGCSCLCNSDDFQAVNKDFAAQLKATESCTDADLEACSTRGMCGHPAPRCEENRCVK